MENALEIILSLVIAGAVLAFGGVQPLAYSLTEVTLFACLLVLLLKQSREGKISLPLPIWPLLFVFFTVLQVVPIPSRLVAAIAPGNLRVPEAGTALTGEVGWTTLSMNVHATFIALAKLLAYLSAFALAAHCFDSRKRKSRIVLSLVLLGFFETCYGTFQYLTGWQKIFGYTKQWYTEDATGTYINHNHFAGFLELTAPLVFGLFFYFFQLWSQGRHDRFQPRASTDSERSAGARALACLFLLVLMAVGLIFSRSRGGILAALFSVIFIALLAQLKARRKVLILGVFLFLVSAVGYGLWIGLDPVLARFEMLETPSYIRMEGRTALWKDELGLIRDHPLVGAGLGVFSSVFRRYQTAQVNFVVDHAHNDYLEFTSETGIIGVTLLFLPILYLFLKMILSFLDDPRRYRGAVTLGCIGATLALLIHSVTDFNLQIPANALTFAVILGIGYKAACLERKNEDQITPQPLVKQEDIGTLH
jgi:O-antigen ligase